MDPLAKIVNSSYVISGFFGQSGTPLNRDKLPKTNVSQLSGVDRLYIYVTIRGVARVRHTRQCRNLHSILLHWLQ